MHAPVEPSPRISEAAQRLLNEGWLLESRDLNQRWAQFWLRELDALPPLDLLAFERAARVDPTFAPEIVRGLRREQPAGRRWLARRRPKLEQASAKAMLWPALALLSRDDAQREEAAGAAAITPATAALLLIRMDDPTAAVQATARARFDAIPTPLLVAGLPLLAALAGGSRHGVDAFLDQRIPDDLLAQGTRDADGAVRLAAWRWRARRGAVAPEAYRDVLAVDASFSVRRLAAEALPQLREPLRASLARLLLRDSATLVRRLAFDALADLEGHGFVEVALTDRRSSMRRLAQRRALQIGVDAAEIYDDRLAADPEDRTGLIGRAEVAAPPTGEAWVTGLTDDPRVAVRIAGMRSLARLDPVRGRAAALRRLTRSVSLRETAAAADVIGEVEDEVERSVVERVLPDRTRPLEQRMLAARLLRPYRWSQLRAFLELLREATDPVVARDLEHRIDAWLASTVVPDGTLPRADRAALQRLCSSLDQDRRQRVAFALRPAAPAGG